MKALSVRQPWAWLIVNGYKPIENRSWPTRYRGEVLIHAGKSVDKEGLAWVRQNFPHIPLPNGFSFECGGIVGQATITGCINPDSPNPSPWYAGEYGFVMKDAKPLPFRPYPGQLGFFEVQP